MPQDQDINIEIKVLWIDIIPADKKNNSTIKEIFEIPDIDNDQDMIQVMKKRVETLKTYKKKQTKASNKLSL